ncbi:hypothetical protein BafHLJ01_0155 [Borreliella afzelii HLJ01]|nr:hypothetical protein BafHLJ01_0155 [Borreliella afzelii HLJ01]
MYIPIGELPVGSPRINGFFFVGENSLIFCAT